MRSVLHVPQGVGIACLGAILGGCLMDASASDPASGSLAEAVTASDVAGPTRMAASNFHRIRNRAFDQCVDAPEGRRNDVLQLVRCHGHATQQWAFIGASAPNTFNIVQMPTAFCVEVNNNTATPGERVDAFDCSGTTAVQWEVSVRIIGGVAYQQFRHAGTDQCLDTVSGKGSQLMQWTCDPNNDAQTWLVE